MYLKELEIFGFKSFPEKIILKFEPGIIVVVGPNGCGKSNIFDSIKWALGEQSPKSLRGAKMEDIIFSGTEHHLSLNYSEVALTFSNEDKYLPIEYKEVSIARKLYRSGESNYFINKNVVRLKDVQNLFMGTGIGESTYSFIEQGKIEIFLSYKPEDKRLIFDEASGIVMYKERKKEALKRLEETDENLLRLDDILSEVSRQIRYLERQVSKAKKYKETKENLVEVEKKIAVLKFSDLENKNNKFLDELKLLSDKEINKNRELAEIKEQWEKIGAQLKEIRQDLAAAASDTVSLNAQAATSQSHIAVSEQRIKEIHERNIKLEQTAVSLNDRAVLSENRMEQERQRLKSIEDHAGVAAGQIKELETQREKIRREIETAKKQIVEDKDKILDLETKKVSHSNQRIEIQANLTTLVKRRTRLALDNARLAEILKEKKELLERVEKDLEALGVSLNALKEKRGGLALKEKELAVYKERLGAKLSEDEKELIELSACYEFLRDLKTKYDKFSVKKRITIIFNEEPKDINKMVVSLKGVAFNKEGNSYKTEIEAKVVSLEEGQLEEKINSTKKEIEEIKKKLESIRVERDKLSQKVSVENKTINEEEKKQQEKLQEKDSLNSEWVRLQEELALIEEEIMTTGQDIANFESKQREIDNELSVFDRQLDAVRQSLESCQDIITQDAERLKAVDIEIVRKEEQKQSFFKEKESLNSKIIFFQEEKSDISKSIENLNKEKETNNQRLVSFTEEMGALSKKMDEFKNKIQELIQQKEGLEKKEEVIVCKIEEKRKAQAAQEKEVQEITSSLYNKKLDIQSIEYEKDKIKDYLRQVYHVEFDKNTAAAEETPQNLCVLMQEKDDIEKRISSLGEVNLIAIEEFDELKKREDFLDKQKQDLIVSKENLKKAIQKINRTTKEIFLETFNKIQEEFKKNFRFLFGGGRAQLILLDPENVLESGVEIEVQPPGKKLQNVSLLSGGEKSLTAISLIFAIFKVKPSPFCVLDEIDAPLDEANVDRFNHLLREFSSLSQFIVITHNKKTMSNADVLYGVTMQERGVSKIVSVKFAAQEKVPA